MVILRALGQPLAYAIIVLLALAWLLAADKSANASLLDLATIHAGEAILRLSAQFGLGPAETLKLARALAAAKAAIGLMLLVGLIAAWWRRRERDHALLEVALFASALGSSIAMVPVIAVGGQPLQGLLGELILCVAAGELMYRKRSSRPCARAASPWPQAAEPSISLSRG